MKRILSLSFGRTSLASLFFMVEQGIPPDIVVFFDTGVEFSCIYDIEKQIQPYLHMHHIQYVRLSNPIDIINTLPIRGWCRFDNRWGTTFKIQTLRQYLDSLHCDYIEYVGIAYDELHRLTNMRRYNQRSILIDNHITRADCLRKVYSYGYYYFENGYRLYDHLDCLSCWCCGNKNLKELRFYKTCLPQYYKRLQCLEKSIGQPFKKYGYLDQIVR